MQDLPESAVCLFGDQSGIYIPQRFATEIIREYVEGVAADDWAALEYGPGHEWYWDAWSSVLDNAEINVPVPGTVSHRVHRLYQDGDLWMVPEDAEWPEE